MEKNSEAEKKGKVLLKKNLTLLIKTWTKKLIVINHLIVSSYFKERFPVFLIGLLMFVHLGESSPDETSFGKIIFEDFGKSDLVDDETSRIGEDEKSFRLELKKELDQNQRNVQNLIPAPISRKTCKQTCY